VKQQEKRPRESLVGSEFRNAVEVVNESIASPHKVRYSTYCGTMFLCSFLPVCLPVETDSINNKVVVLIVTLLGRYIALDYSKITSFSKGKAKAGKQVSG
jgi:hypothetical protein